MRIGIFGGTFNPIHNAHLDVARVFIETLNLNKCLIVPTNISPFKSKISTISNRQRYELIASAIADEDKMEICDFEISKESISYTINTLEYIKSIYTESDLFMLIGADQAAKFDKWKDYKTILDIARICIVSRPDENNEATKLFISNLLKAVGKEPLWIKHSISNITSTIIREKILNCESINGLVPSKVEEIIMKNKLYA